MREVTVGVRSIATALPAMFASTRGATVGLMVGIRDWMLRLGERRALGPKTAGTSRQATDRPVKASANAARRVLISQFARSWTMVASGYALPRESKLMAQGPRD